MRYAIWCAVSTEAQAASDKVSLSEQETQCVRIAADKGWTDTGLRFIVPGESRTRWLDLTAAAPHIPALRQLMSAAEGRKFDVLVLYDYNRLRDLLEPLSRFLRNLNITIYSKSQPVEPRELEDSDTHVIMEGMAGIFSKLQISDLTRKRKYAMPRRIADRGLPANKPPFGYRKPPGHEMDHGAIPIQDHNAVVVLGFRGRLHSLGPPSGCLAEGRLDVFHLHGDYLDAVTVEHVVSGHLAVRSVGRAQRQADLALLDDV